jgi:hypothetical protein
LSRTFTLNHACKTPHVEGAGAASLPAPYPGGTKKITKMKRGGCDIIKYMLLVFHIYLVFAILPILYDTNILIYDQID